MLQLFAARLVIILRLPKKRTEEGQIESIETRAFLTAESVEHLGTTLGIFEKRNDVAGGRIGMILGTVDMSRMRDQILLQVQVHHGLNAELADTLRTPNGRYWHGNSCRDVTYQLAQNDMAVWAGITAKVIRGAYLNTSAMLSVYVQCADGSIAVVRPSIGKVTYLVLQDWTVRLDEWVIVKMSEFRNSKLPIETGGVLLGAFDTHSRICSIVDALPSPPDSQEWPTSYIRGCVGLRQKVKEVEDITLGQLGYVGEWHSHPSGASILPSVDDRQAYSWLIEHMHGGYFLKARVLVAVLVSLPILIILPWLTETLHFPHNPWLLSGLVGAAVVALGATIVRQFGVLAEKKINSRRGGFPTTLIMRWSDGTKSREWKRRMHDLVRQKLGMSLCSEETEANDVKEADKIIQDAFLEIRHRIWGNKGLPSHAANIDYGFARNLYGCRWLWLLLIFACLSTILVVSLVTKASFPLQEMLLCVVLLIIVPLIEETVVKHQVEHCAYRYAEHAWEFLSR
ncbi:hypothetical protein ES703_21624 [subsurface metagenome]